MLEENYGLLDRNDFLKFVVDTKEDVTEFEQWVFSHNYIGCNVAVGTFWGSKISYADLIEKVVETTWLIPVYLNMQTHKMTCLYDHYEDVTHIFVPRTL